MGYNWFNWIGHHHITQQQSNTKKKRSVFTVLDFKMMMIIILPLMILFDSYLPSSRILMDPIDCCSHSFSAFALYPWIFFFILVFWSSLAQEFGADCGPESPPPLRSLLNAYLSLCEVGTMCRPEREKDGCIEWMRASWFKREHPPSKKGETDWWTTTVLRWMWWYVFGWFTWEGGAFDGFGSS